MGFHQKKPPVDPLVLTGQMIYLTEMWSLHFHCCFQNASSTVGPGSLFHMYGTHCLEVFRIASNLGLEHSHRSLRDQWVGWD